MPLPLPQVIPNTEPGGNVLSGMRHINALIGDQLKNKLQALTNQYYPQKTQADINYTNAQTSKVPSEIGLNEANSNRLNTLLPYEVDEKGIENKFLPSKLQALINSTNAQTNRTNMLLPADLQNKELENEWYAKKAQAYIDQQKALAGYRQMGGSGAGVGAKEHALLQNYIQRENPNFTPDQVFQAANGYLNGDSSLPDGTPLPPASGLVQSVVDQISKRGSTAALITNSVGANQADAEVDVLDDYAQRGLKPYGDTYANMSPAQIEDSFKDDDESQKRLGQLIAAQALQYEIAQQRIKLAQGQPGATSTQELMDLSGQRISTSFPKLSYKARQEASRYMTEALKAGLKARNKIGIGAGVSKGSNSSGKATLRFNPATGDFEKVD